MRMRSWIGWSIAWMAVLAGVFSCPALARDIVVINEGSGQKVKVGYLAPTTSTSLWEKDGPPIARTRKVELGAACFVDPATWKVTGTVPVGPDPVDALISPDGSHAYVVSRGIADADPADTSGQGSLTIIDLSSRSAVATLCLGYRPQGRALAPDSAWLVCVSTGSARHAAVATLVDLREHRLLGRVRLPDSTRGSVLSKDGRRLYALAVREGLGKESTKTGTVRSIDTATLSTVAEFTLEGVPLSWALSPDGHWLYVVETHATWSGPVTDSTMVLAVVETDSGSVAARYPVGGTLGPMDVDDSTGRLCICGKSAEQDRKWQLFVFRGDSLSGRAPLTREPTRFDAAPGGRLGFIGYGNDLAIVDLVEGRERAIIDIGLAPADVHLRDEKCIVVVGQRGTKVAIVDVDHEAAVTKINAGRHGFKLASGFLMAAAMTAGNAYLGATNPWYTSSSSYQTMLNQGYLNLGRLHGMGLSRGSVSCSPDGKQYFVFDAETNDITVIDVDARKKTKTIPVGASAFGSQLHEIAVVGERWIVVSRKGDGQSLGIVDMELQKRVGNVELKVEAAPSGMTVDAVHDRVLVPIGKGLQVVRVSTAKHEALVGMDHPRLVLVPGD